MKGKYKKGSTYCYGCDADIVSIGKKCTVCGTKMKGSKDKKPNTKRILKDNDL